MSGKIALIALVVVLMLVNWSIVSKERQLATGRIVYLELAPVDPRSLMQGDFMALRFRVANEVYNALPKMEEDARWGHDVGASDGYVIVKVDERGIGTFKAIYDNQALANDEVRMRYRVRNGQVKFATNAYFFQEGHAMYYEAARYGQFRVNKDGELLLAAMFDEGLNKLEPRDNN